MSEGRGGHPPPDSEYYDYLEPPGDVIGREYRLMVNMIIGIFVFLVFVTLGLMGSPRASSAMMWILLAAYIVSVTTESLSEYSWMFVLAMVSLHLGSIISYYSNPLILPFVVVERGGGHESVAIDWVQIVVLVEVVRHFLQGKSIKSPGGGREEGGRAPQEPR